MCRNDTRNQSIQLATINGTHLCLLMSNQTCQYQISHQQSTNVHLSTQFAQTENKTKLSDDLTKQNKLFIGFERGQTNKIFIKQTELMLQTGLIRKQTFRILFLCDSDRSLVRVRRDSEENNTDKTDKDTFNMFHLVTVGILLIILVLLFLLVIYIICKHLQKNSDQERIQRNSVFIVRKEHDDVETNQRNFSTDSLTGSFSVSRTGSSAGTVAVGPGQSTSMLTGKKYTSKFFQQPKSSLADFVFSGKKQFIKKTIESCLTEQFRRSKLFFSYRKACFSNRFFQKPLVY